MHEQVVNYIALGLITALTWLARRAIKAFEKKTKIDVDQATETLIESLIEKGVRYVEEKYAKKGSIPKDSSTSKQADVKSFVEDELRKRGINSIPDNLNKHIDAVVNRLYHSNEQKSGTLH